MVLTQEEFYSGVDSFCAMIAAVFQSLDDWQLFAGFSLLTLFYAGAFVAISVHTYNRLTVPVLHETPA